MPRQRTLNDRQRKFAELLASGMSKVQAYREAGYEGAEPHKLAPKLAAKPEVQAYLAQLREDARTAAVLEIAEKRQFLARVIRTPIGEVDENSDLAQERTVRHGEDGSTVEKVKMMNKAEAIRLDNQLAGHVQSGPSVSIQNNVIPEVVHRSEEEQERFLVMEARVLKKLGLVRVAGENTFPDRN